MLSGEVCSRYGEDGLAEDTIRINFSGVAGQSFAAFLSKGITFRLTGIANDYVGKGLFGGKIIISPFRQTRYKRPNNIIVGNTVLYGAVTGEVYIRGVAGERFAVRNSGVYAVVEGVGEHGCEYMTGGRVIVLGEIGRNFAAGMSGGIAYIYRNQPGLRDCCNLAMVTLDNLDEGDRQTIYNMLTNHYQYTSSEKASYILEDFDRRVTNFVKVMPKEYKLILQMQQKIKNSNYQELDG
jgi:glutamate synthase domain-containing protein 3